MAIKDIKNQLVQSIALASTAIAADTTVPGAVFDTADNELGLMFAVSASEVNGGTAALLLEESESPVMSGAVALTGDKILGDLADATVSAATVAGAALATVGVISNKRYVRASLVGDASSDLTAQIICTQETEYAAVGS